MQLFSSFVDNGNAGSAGKRNNDFGSLLTAFQPNNNEKDKKANAAAAAQV